MAGRGTTSPIEFPRRANTYPLNTARVSLLSDLARRLSSARYSNNSNEKYKYDMKDPLELVYTISTKTLRKAHRSELLHHQDDGTYELNAPKYRENISQERQLIMWKVSEPFTVQPFENPPLLLDGRRMVIEIPPFTSKVWFYWQTLEIDPNGTRQSKRKKRCVDLPLWVMIERNLLGMWKELWIEHLANYTS